METQTQAQIETQNSVVAAAANGKVNLVGDDSFVDEVLEAGIPVLVDFKAEWCGPCKVMGPIFNDLAGEYEGRVRFAKLDVDDSPGVAGALHIGSIPTFMLIQGRTVYAQGVGSMPAASLRQWIDNGLEYIASNPQPEIEEAEADADESADEQ